MIEALLFDKDGTIFDFNASWGAWGKSLIDQFADGNETRREMLSKQFAFDYQEMRFEPISPIITGSLEEAVAAIQSVRGDLSASEISQVVSNSSGTTQMVPICDLGALFGEFSRRGIACGIATNDAEASARAHLEAAGIKEHFCFIAGYDSGFGAKPDPGMCAGFLMQAGVGPKSAAMIGDTSFDIRAGKSAGMVTIGVLSGGMGQSEIDDADVILTDISEIPAWIDGEIGHLDRA